MKVAVTLIFVGNRIIMSQNKEKYTNGEGTLDLFIEVVIVCMIAFPTLIIWFPDAPNLLSDLYSSTVIFFVELIT